LIFHNRFPEFGENKRPRSRDAFNLTAQGLKGYFQENSARFCGFFNEGSFRTEKDSV
jgi:hypothetical protein